MKKTKQKCKHEYRLIPNKEDGRPETCNNYINNCWYCNQLFYCVHCLKIVSLNLSVDEIINARKEENDRT